MSVKPVYWCDGLDCTHHVGGSLGSVPFGWLRIVEDAPEPGTLEFCSWDCVLRYASQFPPIVTIHIDDVPPLDGCDETRGSA